MEPLIVYFAKASGLLAVFIIAYHAFLKKETFFNANRKFLLAGLFTSLLLPLIVYTKKIMVEPAPVNALNTININKLVMLQQMQPVVHPEITIDLIDVVAMLYVAGVLFFLGRLIFDVATLRKIVKRYPAVKDNGFRLIDAANIQSPFSFFNYIVYNSAELKPDELESIISHEKVHSRQKHSLDMIVGQLFCIAFWFNPFAWLYKKAISQNLEFIADAEATKQLADKRAYQKTLLKITLQPNCTAISNHFYQSLIKKRIVMLNKKQSKKRNSWKYAIVLPALAAFMLLFQVKTVAQEKKMVENVKTKLSLEITKDSKDAELNAEKGVFKNEFDTDLDFQNIKRNNNNEITAIKVVVKDKSQSRVYEVAGTSPIQPFTIDVEKSDSSNTNTINFSVKGKNNFSVSANDFFVQGTGIDDNDTIWQQGKERILNRHGQLIVPPAPMAPPATGWSVNSMKINGKDLLVVIDGVKQKKGENVIKLPINREIDEMIVLKEKEGKKKYGKEGKDGVVEITTKKESGNILKMVPGQSFGFSLPEGGFEFNFNNDDFAQNFAHGSEAFEGLEKLFENFDIADPEVSKKIDEALKEHMVKPMEPGMWDDIQKRFNSDSPEDSKKLSDDILEAKKEMLKAKKEMEDAKKEMEQSRKELEKTRRDLNKKV